MLGLERYIIESLQDVKTMKTFKKWFGKSKLKNKDGSPKVMYHGTRAEFNEFRVNNELGAHFGDEEAANAILYGSSGKIMEVYLRCENPIRVDDMLAFDFPTLCEYFEEDEPNKLPKEELEKILEFKKEWIAIEFNSPQEIRKSERMEKEGEMMFVNLFKKMGHDSVVYRNQREGKADSYIIFDPNQVKSIYNEGKFSRKDNNIYK
ncbi:P domain-containing [Tenacibaculum phage pT24]|uniref:P domain-containing n=1 Tax=Tenacibaculum phage pT24 TaxID=1880590 RepID=A0A1B4XWU0_9CAUD|nr:P domain-containing [Tenacibaculum phage pT24]BAV39282.1 P domain-containing [Tenacibaculum phage pT24]